MSQDPIISPSTEARESTLREITRILSLFSALPSRRAQRHYETFRANDLMTDNTTYVNLGYWTSECDSMDDACQAMADLIAQKAGLQPGDHVLDAGFGFGDQDFYWLDRYKPEKITGINITPYHVEIARRRVQDRNLEGKLDLTLGSATDMKFEPQSFDKVIALESAFNFRTREDFLKQAYGVLKPDGTIVAADIISTGAHSTKNSMQRWIENSMRARLVGIPKANWYTSDIYGGILSAIGFTDISIVSIRDNVYVPLGQYLHRKVKDPDFRKRISPFFHSMMKMGLRSDYDFPDNDYVLVSAKKPSDQ
jgi:erythromycin 3''-O-methyltransferase